MDKEECRLATVDDDQKHRTKEKYAATVLSIKEKGTGSVDLKETKGIKSHCELNNLNHFHILDNFAVDIMHDLLEGTIGFLLSRVFSYCFDEKIFSEESLSHLMLFFDYGQLNSQNVPSALNLNRKNLGQNASQMKCLFQNLPLILYNYKNDLKLKKVWPCVDSMLKILQIIYSSSICESDLANLKLYISVHLTSLIEVLKTVLIPKHHMMLHYPKVIEKVGPLVHLSTLRFEMKHREFTRHSKQSNNFKSVSKSLSKKHQRTATFRAPYKNVLNHGSSRPFKNDILLLNTNANRTFDVTSSFSEVSWLKINSFNYKKGLLLRSGESFFEIKNILENKNDYYFVCSRFEYVGFDKFLQCIELEKCEEEEDCILPLSELKHKRSHDKKKIQDRIYVIVDSLELVYIVNE